MKTIYTTLIAALIGVSAFSQSSILAPRGGHVPRNPVTRNANPTAQTTQSFYCDYGFMDEDYQTNTQGLTYSRYIWDMNMRYSLANGDTSLNWAAVDFSPLYNTDYTTSYPFPTVASTSYSTMSVDTIFFNAGHSNYSGVNDTVLVQILQCTSGGYPNPTATVLHTDTIISNVSLTGSNTWLSNGTFFVTPNYIIPNNSIKFAVRVEYFGNAADTFGMTAGFGDLGAGNCPANPSLPNFAVPSQYATNSYRADMRFAPPLNTYPQLPSSSGADTYYDCDGVSGHIVGSDSENFLQNWDLWVHVTADPLAVDEANGSIRLGQNIPNPSTGETLIPYTLKNSSQVTLKICDVTGNVVMTQSEESSAGNHNFNFNSASLAAGVYFYTVTTNQGSATRKMIVQ